MKRTRKYQKLLIKEKKKLQAKKQNDWGPVLKLLDQEFENSLRQDSHYHLTSLNKIVSDDGKYTELIDLVRNNDSNPLKTLTIFTKTTVRGTFTVVLLIVFSS